MNRETADRWLLRAMATLLLIQLVCGVAFTGMVRPEDFLVAMGISVLLLILWIARIWTNQSLKVSFPPVGWCVVAFIVMTVVWAFLADVPYVARSELLRGLVYGVVFATALHCFRSRGAIRTLVFVLLVLALANTIYAGYQAAVDPDHVWHFERPKAYGYGRRGSGFFINPNNLAILLAMILPIILAFALVSRLKPVPKIFLGYSSLVLIVGIGLTLSRGGWIATSASMLLFFAALIRMRAYRKPALVALITLACLGGYFISQSEMGKIRLRTAIEKGPQGNIRYHIWKTAWDMWQDNAWAGVGPGHFDVRYREYRSREMQARPHHVHNDYLNTLADLGVLGFTLALATLGAFFLSVKRSWSSLQKSLAQGPSMRSDRLALTLGVTTSIVALLFHSIFDFPIHIPGLAMLVVALMATLLGLPRHSKPRHELALQAKGKTIATLLALVIGGFLTCQGAIRFQEYRHVYLAERGSTSFDEQIAHMEEACRIEPGNPVTPFLIAEIYRLQSFKAGADYEEQAKTAIRFYEVAIEVDPHDPVRLAHLGMCLDWLGKHDQAWPYYERALERDPIGFYTASMIGWHYAQLRDYKTAKTWFELSFKRNTADNSLSWHYLQIIEERLKGDPSR